MDSILSACSAGSGCGEWVEQRHAGDRDVCSITRHKCQTVHLCGRRQETVDEGQRIGDSNMRPYFRDRLVDWQDPIAEPRPHLEEPSIEEFALPQIAPPLELDAATDFGE